VTGDDDNRRYDAARFQSRQHAKAIDLRHVQIQHEAVRRVRGQRRQEILSALVGFRAETMGSKQAPQRFAHLRLVIEHGDDWRCLDLHAINIITKRGAPLLYLS
jgi:hypothetical protein